MAKKKIPEAFLTNTQIRELESEIRSLERMGKTMEYKIQDPAEFKKSIWEKKKLLAEASPQKLKGAASNKALKRAREIEGKLKEMMLPRKDYHQMGGNDFDFHRAVQYEVGRMRDKKYKSLGRELKSLWRQIDPSDPTLSNIERLRA